MPNRWFGIHLLIIFWLHEIKRAESYNMGLKKASKLLNLSRSALRWWRQRIRFFIYLKIAAFIHFYSFHKKLSCWVIISYIIKPSYIVTKYLLLMFYIHRTFVALYLWYFIFFVTYLTFCNEYYLDELNVNVGTSLSFWNLFETIWK